VKNNNPEHLVAVDATSSMAGISLNFSSADIWFASVQKCFGLPAGLALMVCSPKAIERVEAINERNHYNSLAFMDDMIQKFQTPFTPNVLNIYLLMRVMDDAPDIEATNEKIEKRYRKWMDFLAEQKSMQHLIRNQAAHSFTVLPLKAAEDTVTAIKKAAKGEGFLLGEGYGDLKASTFRISNFPALKKKEIESLKKFLTKFGR
jgi:phosphoserine aminotransferase